MKEEHISLMKEELESLDNFKEICVYEDEERKIFISIPYIKENALRSDILERYNNSEYWDNRIEEDIDISEVEEINEQEEADENISNILAKQKQQERGFKI
ncbi:MAG: hypothetical protein WC781_05695 [Candidatus Pacearchaeota archaeon]|jgi:hypothetical protein